MAPSISQQGSYAQAGLNAIYGFPEGTRAARALGRKGISSHYFFVKKDFAIESSTSIMSYSRTALAKAFD